MFISAVGHSEDPDAREAMIEIRESIEGSFSGQQIKAGMLFASIDFDREELLTTVDEFWPGIELIGCTTDGEVSSKLGFMEDSVVLILFASDSIDITAGIGAKLSENTETACHKAVNSARSKTDKEPVMCIAFPDVLNSSGQRIVDSLVFELGRDVPLLGGAAGDQWRLQKTYQFYGNQILSDSIPVLLFSGPLDISFSAGFGCELVGKEALVTKSDGTLLQEINSEPATEYFKSILGEGTKPANEVPLAVLNEDGEVDYLRTPATDFGSEMGAVHLFADIREGSRVQSVLMDRDSLVAGCADAVNIAEARFPSGKNPDVVLIFSCAGRKIMLGMRTEEEQRSVREVVDSTVPCAGFYTYGEICPSVSVEEGAKFHNHTFVIALLGEKDE